MAKILFFISNNNNPVVRWIKEDNTFKQLVLTNSSIIYQYNIENKIEDQWNFNIPSVEELNSGIITADSGFTITGQWMKKWGNIVQFYCVFTRSSVIPAGNITNIQIGTLQKYKPLMASALSSANQGPILSGAISTNGVVSIAAAGSETAAGTECSLQGTYITSK